MYDPVVPDGNLRTTGLDFVQVAVIGFHMNKYSCIIRQMIGEMKALLFAECGIMLKISFPFVQV